MLRPPPNRVNPKRPLLLELGGPEGFSDSKIRETIAKTVLDYALKIRPDGPLLIGFPVVLPNRDRYVYGIALKVEKA